MKSGIELITEERKRQIEKEGFDAEHDSQHDAGELAFAAICYASPEPVFILKDYSAMGQGFSFADPWPESWYDEWDKRLRTPGGKLCPNINLHVKKRIRNLVKAGALISAEIDRLMKENEQSGFPWIPGRGEKK